MSMSILNKVNRFFNGTSSESALAYINLRELKALNYIKGYFQACVTSNTDIEDLCNRIIQYDFTMDYYDQKIEEIPEEELATLVSEFCSNWVYYSSGTGNKKAYFNACKDIYSKLKRTNNLCLITTFYNRECKSFSTFLILEELGIKVE